MHKSGERLFKIQTTMRNFDMQCFGLFGCQRLSANLRVPVALYKVCEEQCTFTVQQLLLPGKGQYRAYPRSREKS